MTVERDRMVEWWPLVDVGQLDLREGDVVIMRTTERLSPASFQRMREEWHRAYPGALAVVIARADAIDFFIHRPMPEMRAEDLVQPERARNMGP